MKNFSISAVVPCYNEEDSITKTVRRLNRIVDEVIVVDNGSTDNSVQNAIDAGARVIIEPRKQNGIGYGYALITGIRAAKSDYIVTIDADGEHPIEKITEIVSYARENKFDFVNCSRISTESSKLNTLIRRSGIFLLSTLTGIIFNFPTKDILSGMWVIKRQTIKLLSIYEGDWNLSPEIKLAAITNPDISYTEYPIVATVRENGKSKQILWRTALQHLIFIVDYRLRTIPALRFLSYKFLLQKLAVLRQ